MKIIIRTSLLWIFFWTGMNVFAQDISTIYVVEKGNNVPVTGATVMDQDKKPLGSTNDKGLIRIALDQDEKYLIASHLGFEDATIELERPLPSEIIIELSRGVTNLDDVVVSTGYQEIPKERVTGSFTVIDNEVFSQQVGHDVLARLPAIANGVSFENNARVGLNVRGLSTIQGILQPLIILDNFPYEGSLENLNPSDIQNITILKDAAAASIWGTKAANGVIVITTKKGEYNRPLRVSFGSSLQLGRKPDLFYFNPMRSDDYIDMEIMLYKNGFYEPYFTSIAQQGLSPVVEMLKKKESANEQERGVFDDRIAALRTHDVRNDFLNHVYRPSVNQQYALSFNGGQERSAWIVSGGYDRNKDELGASFNRLNLRYDYSLRLGDRLELTSGMSMTDIQRQSGMEGYGDVSSVNNMLFPYTELLDQQGNPQSIVKNIRSTYVDTVGDGKLLDWHYIPLEDYKYNRMVQSSNNIHVNTGLEYKPLKGLTLSLKHRYEREIRDIKNEMGVESYNVREMINLYTEIEPDGNILHHIPLGGIYDLSESRLHSHNLRGQITFSQKWKQHDLYTILGGEIRDTRTETDSRRDYGVDENTLQTNIVDFKNPHPTFITGARRYIPYSNGLGEFNNRFVSMFANATYSFRDRYIFTGSVRRDASNLFGVDINDKWLPLWSAGSAWILSEEDFFKSNSIQFMKIRASYGFSGNVDPRKSAVTTILFLSPSVFTGTSTARIERFANPELKWEKTSTLNLGADFAFYDGRIKASIDYYKKRGLDLFGYQEMDYTAGVGPSIVKNVASMDGRGMDIELNTLNTVGGVRWSSQLNFSRNKDKITENYLPSGNARSFVGLGGGARVTGLVDKPVYSILSYKWGGLNPENGNPRGFINGQLSEDYAAILGSELTVEDLVFHGSVLPEYFGSFGNTVSYKGFTLAARLMYKFGYFFRRESIGYGSLVNTGRGHSDYSKRWKKPGDEVITQIPSFVYPIEAMRDNLYQGSHLTVERGDHIRLQYINLDYDLGSMLDKTSTIQDLNVYINLNNVGIIWKKNNQGIDPDFIHQYPNPMTIALGIKGTF